jgi:hypothetical protein
MDDEILHNLKAHVFYHATSLDAAESIARGGFRVWFTDADGDHYAGGGNLGNGVYITCNWRQALWFGHVLLRVAIRRGTRFLNSALPPDGDCIKYLQREFGREILTKSPWKVLPRNKKLTLHELVNLFRYHYSSTWGKENVWDDNWWRGLKRWEMHCRRLDDFRSMLIRYGFHGYGNPQDDNGIVVFAGDRLMPVEVVAEVPSDASGRYGTVDPAEYADLDQVRSIFRRSGSERAKRLADFVAARRSAGEE